jgi:hypothetical protein
LPAAFAAFVAAFSAELKEAQALSGKYRFFPSDGLPSEVRHFCFVQAAKSFCGFFTDTRRLSSCIRVQVTVLCERTIHLDLHLWIPP